MWNPPAATPRPGLGDTVAGPGARAKPPATMPRNPAPAKPRPPRAPTPPSKGTQGGAAAAAERTRRGARVPAQVSPGLAPRPASR